jgi:hypothetical protein
MIKTILGCFTAGFSGEHACIPVIPVTDMIPRSVIFNLSMVLIINENQISEII